MEDLKQRLDFLEKNYGRLCQNDSIMRKELSIAFKRLDKQAEEIDILKDIINKLHQECQRLYQTGFTNGVEVARKEYADEMQKLKDEGLLTFHGFLRDKTADNKADDLFKQLGFKTEKGKAVIFDKSPTDEDFIKAQELIDKKWLEENVNKFERTHILSKEELYNQMKVTQIDPVEAEYYRQMDKAIGLDDESSCPEVCDGCKHLYCHNHNYSGKIECRCLRYKKSIYVSHYGTDIVLKPELFKE